MQNRRAIKQTSPHPHWIPDDQGRAKLPRGKHQIKKSFLRTFENRLLLEKIVKAVPGYAKLGKNNNRHVPFSRLPSQSKHALNVECRIRKPHRWNRNSRPDESVGVNRIEWKWAIHARLLDELIFPGNELKYLLKKEGH